MGAAVAAPTGSAVFNALLFPGRLPRGADAFIVESPSYKTTYLSFA
jgi:hypothetical protein